jgi:hypothetical protein
MIYATRVNILYLSETATTKMWILILVAVITLVFLIVQGCTMMLGIFRIRHVHTKGAVIVTGLNHTDDIAYGAIKRFMKEHKCSVYVVSSNQKVQN